MGEADVAGRLETLFHSGRESFDSTGVVHIAAAWRQPLAAGRSAEPLRVLRIQPDSPRSATDAFLLSALRARADAVLTTGRILRDEAQLTHRFIGSASESRAFAIWRRDVLQRRTTWPRSAVLTSGRDLPLEHPVFAPDSAPLVLSSAEGCATLRGWARERGVELVALAEPGPRSALEALRARGASTIAVEAGPSTAIELYQSPVAIDELLLSTYLEADLPEHLRGPAIPTPADLAAALPIAAGGCERSEESGRWRFERRLRRAGPVPPAAPDKR